MLPSGWEERISKTQGVVYYFNTVDGTSSWQLPEQSQGEHQVQQFGSPKRGAKPPSSEENCGVGLQFITRNNGDVEVVRVRQGGPADFAGVLVGDKVTAVNGVSTHDPLSTGIDVARLILGPEGSTAQLDVMRGSEARNFMLVRRPFPKTDDLINKARMLTSPSYDSPARFPHVTPASSAIQFQPSPGVGASAGAFGNSEPLEANGGALSVTRGSPAAGEVGLEIELPAQADERALGLKGGGRTRRREREEDTGVDINTYTIALRRLWCALCVCGCVGVAALVLAVWLWIADPPVGVRIEIAKA